jgi:hypothetical protein
VPILTGGRTAIASAKKGREKRVSVGAVGGGGGDCLLGAFMDPEYWKIDVLVATMPIVAHLSMAPLLVLVATMPIVDHLSMAPLLVLVATMPIVTHLSFAPLLVLSASSGTEV